MGMGEELKWVNAHVQIILAKTKEVYLVGVVAGTAGRWVCSEVASDTCRQPTGLGLLTPTPERGRGGRGAQWAEKAGSLPQ